MSEIINIEQAVLDNLRILPAEKQQEVLDFVEFLVEKAKEKKTLISENVESGISLKKIPEKRLSLQEIARLPVAERHKILSPYIAATAEDFLNDPELTE